MVFLTRLKKSKTKRKGKQIKKAALKGQLISECLFDILTFPNNQRKISALEYQKYSNKQNKGTSL